MRGFARKTLVGGEPSDGTRSDARKAGPAATATGPAKGACGMGSGRSGIAPTRRDRYCAPWTKYVTVPADGSLALPSISDSFETSVPACRQTFTVRLP